MSTASLPSERTAWRTILLIVGAGVVSSFQVGKASIALAAVQGELGLSLATVSWLISAFAIVGAVAGAPIGLGVDRIGAKRIAVVGLLIMGAGSLLGALSNDAASILATRVIEGLGFLGLVVAAPALIALATPVIIRDRAMAVWATFMPAGLTIIMLATPLLDLLTWRGFWVLNAVILVGYAALLSRFLGGATPERGRDHRPILEDVGTAVVSAGPWVLGALFAAFSAGSFAVLGFLPLYLSERLGIGGDMAGVLSAVAVAASGVGNIACGQFLARGGVPTHLLLGGFGVMGLCGFGIFSPMAPAAMVFALCVLFCFASGLVPVVLFDSAPRFSPRRNLVGVTLGFAMQGNNVGLIVGPAVVGSTAASFGWPSVALPVAVIALIAAFLVIPFHALERRQPGA